VIEADGGYRIQAPVPGFSPEEVEVTFADGLLRISARYQEEKTEQEGEYVRCETAFGNFIGEVSLPGEVKVDDIEAGFQNGVLTVDVPPQSEAPTDPDPGASRRAVQRQAEGRRRFRFRRQEPLMGRATLAPGAQVFDLRGASRASCWG
jgi:hypothetical protein